MKRTLNALCGFLLLAATAIAQPASPTTTPDTAASARSPAASQQRTQLWLTVGTQRFAMTLEDSPTARAFVQLLPATFNMADLNGNEKHVLLPRSLPTHPERPDTIRTGDVMLYGDDTLVVFYETFRSNYRYTRIGRIAQSADLARTLGSGGSHITFAMP